MSRSPSLPSKPRLVRMTWLAWLCALCLLGMQGLGQLHGIAHGVSLQNTLSSAATGAVTMTVEVMAKVTAKVAVSGGWGHQSGDADCHVFDHLSQGQFLASQTALDGAAVAPLQAAAPVWAGAELVARWKRSARAPPLSA